MCYQVLFVFYLFVRNYTHKTADRIFVKILQEMCIWTWKSLLNFGSYPDLDQDPTIFFVGPRHTPRHWICFTRRSF